MRHLSLAILFPLLLAADSVADPLKGFSSEQIQNLKAGKQVVVTQNVKGNAWPRITIHQISSASPEQVAAIFFDFESAKDFIPNVLKSKIVRRINPRTIDVDYELDVPFLPDEAYTAHNRVRRDGSGYLFEWNVPQGKHFKKSTGSFRVQPCEGGSLLSYTNFVEPNSAIARVLRSQAVRQCQDTVQAITSYASRQAKENPPSLNTQVEALRAAVNAR